MTIDEAKELKVGDELTNRVTRYVVKYLGKYGAVLATPTTEYFTEYSMMNGVHKVEPFSNKTSNIESAIYNINQISLRSANFSCGIGISNHTKEGLKQLAAFILESADKLKSR